MPTIFQRLKHHKITAPQETKIKIGKEVTEAFFAQKKRPRIFKISQKEPEGEFMVLSYPKTFINVIDAVIFKHIPKPKRARTNKVYTAKPGKK